MKPRRAHIAIEQNAGFTYLLAGTSLLRRSRRIVHECHSDGPPPGGTTSPVPAIPPEPRPSREAAIALALPGAEAVAG